MAQVLLQRALPDWSVESAGLAAVVGAGAEPHAIAAMAELGPLLESHRAQQVEPDMVKAAELVLTMTQAQTREVERLFPWSCGRVFRMGHWEGFDIEDPYQLPPEAFMRTRQKLDAAVASWIPRLAPTRIASKEFTRAH
jgi:protein-tyrosine phosphatase